MNFIPSIHMDIPVDILPSFCMTPKCVASVRLTCSAWSRLLPPQRVFNCDFHEKCATISSDYYRIILTGDIYSGTTSATINGVPLLIDSPYQRVIEFLYGIVAVPDIGVEYTPLFKYLYYLHANNYGYDDPREHCSCTLTSGHLIVVGKNHYGRFINYADAQRTFERRPSTTLYISADAAIDTSACAIHNDFLARILYTIRGIVRRILPT